MDIGKAFAFIGEDDEWISKLGIGALLAAIPLVNFAAFGYQIQIAKNVARGEERPLPTWDNFGQYFIDGLRLIAAFFVYMLPVVLLYFLLAAGLIFYSTTLDPYSSSSYSPNGPPPEIFLFMGIVLACIMPYMFFIYAIFPMLSIQIARHGSVASCFRMGEMWHLFRAQIGNYILLTIIMVGLYMGGSLLLMPIMLVAIFIPCVGFIISMLASGTLMFITMSVTGHMEGQFMQGIAKPTDVDDYVDQVSFDG